MLESRRTPDNETRRRRECLFCNKRWTTYERIARTDVFVIKRDNKKELFDRNKIFKGMMLALEKRPVVRERIEKAADRIESKILAMNKSTIKSKVLGALVMDELRGLDEVGYIRFASVYKKFKDPTQFVRTITELKKEEKHAKNKIKVKRH